MTEVSTISNKQRNAAPRTVVEFVGHVFAYGSLLCSAFFWMAIAFHHIPRVPQVNLTGFDWFRIMALAMFFFDSCVMGT